MRIKQSFLCINICKTRFADRAATHISQSGLANVNTRKRMFYPLIDKLYYFHAAISYHLSKKLTSSPKGNDAHLRAIIQSEKKWKHQFFRRLRAASSAVRGRIWPNFKLIEALMYVIITCKYEKDPIKNYREKVATPFFKL